MTQGAGMGLCSRVRLRRTCTDSTQGHTQLDSVGQPPAPTRLSQPATEQPRAPPQVIHLEGPLDSLPFKQSQILIPAFALLPWQFAGRNLSAHPSWLVSPVPATDAGKGEKCKGPVQLSTLHLPQALPQPLPAGSWQPLEGAQEDRGLTVLCSTGHAQARGWPQELRCWSSHFCWVLAEPVKLVLPKLFLFFNVWQAATGGFQLCVGSGQLS